MLNVLIVEDEFVIADLLQDVLEGNGYSVSGVARTVEEAFTSVEQRVPDFAVIDIRLANSRYGTEVGAHLRATSGAGILFSTGNDDNGTLTKAQGDAVMTKPYRLSDVARGLTIIQQMQQFGQTTLPLPRNFRLLK